MKTLGTAKVTGKRNNKKRIAFFYKKDILYIE